MAEEKSELEKAVQIIISKIETINKDTAALKPLEEKLDLLPDKPKEKNTYSEKHKPLKESYQLFFAVILGAIGAELIHPMFDLNFANQFPWIFVAYVGIILTFLVVFSFIGGYLPRWLANLKK